MRSKFDEQLNQLNKEMMNMGVMIDESIQKAIKALMKQDVDLATEIMTADEEVDRQQKKIEQICFNLLIQQQPVARDLRMITAAMKMVTDMERIGDHAADISEMTVVMADHPYQLNLGSVNRMASETTVMLIQSIEAYIEKDISKAKKVIERDDVVDGLFDQLKSEIIEMIHSKPEEAEQTADMLMVGKYFERIGDHATNIAEWVIFSLEEKSRG